MYSDDDDDDDDSLDIFAGLWTGYHNSKFTLIYYYIFTLFYKVKALVFKRSHEKPLKFAQMVTMMITAQTIGASCELAIILLSSL